MPDWKDKSSYERLLAAVIAAHPGLKLDYRKMATFFGNGATYDSIEGRFRPIRKNAEQMKKDVESGTLQEAPLRGSASANVTPRKPRTPKTKNIAQDGVLQGRITKAAASTSPAKRRGQQQQELDLVETSSVASCNGDIYSGGSSDDTSASYSRSLTAGYDSQFMSFQDTILVDSTSTPGIDELSFWTEEHIV